MDKAELVLEYIKVLAWPAVIGGALIAFRVQIGAKIESLSRVSTPIGDADFDREAKALEQQADAAAARQDAQRPPEPPEPGPDTELGGGPKQPTPPSQPPATAEAPENPLSTEEPEAHQEPVPEPSAVEDAIALRAVVTAAELLNNRPDFETALEVSGTSPNAAVMLAYTELEKIARAAWTADRMEPAPPRLTVPQIVGDLGGTLDPEFPRIARNLSELRNRVTHGDTEVSTNGALDFIVACERLADVLGGKSWSKLRHPSRAGVLQQWERTVRLRPWTTSGPTETSWP